MRIGLVLDESLDGTDGVQQYMLRVGGWLTEKGHEVHYIVGETHRTDLPNIHSVTRNLHVHFNGNRLSTPLPARRATLRGLLAELKLDVLHIQTPYSPFMAGKLMRLAPKNTAVVGTFHILPYSWLASLASYGLGVLNNRTAKRFDEVMAVSVPAQQFARSHYGLTSTVVPNCFDFARFKAGMAKKDGKTIVYLGRLVERKGPFELLKAVAYLCEHEQWVEGWKVILGGKGPMLGQLQEYIAAHKLADIVTLAGFVDEADKANFLAQGSIAVFPSIAGESFGISLLEAMAATPGVVLGGDNPGYRSVMEGFEEQLCDPRNTQAFADLLTHWMQDSAARDNIAKRQQAYVQKFDDDEVGVRIVAVYEKALQKRRKA